MTSPPVPSRPSNLVSRFRAEQGRRAIIEEARRMYAEDGRASEIIETLARDAVKGGFTLSIEGPRAEEAEEVAVSLLSRLKLPSRLDDWVRLTARDGDSFLELSATARGEIVEVTRKPTLEMHSNADRFDRFPDPSRAYWWSDQVFGFGDAPVDAIWFAEWQIVHARYRRDEGSRYGRPLFAPAQKAYKRLSEGELDIAIRRKTRAGMKYVHSLEDASEPDIEAYKQRNREVLDDPFAAIADFFSNKRATIQAIQGDARLSEIDDVLHHLDTWATVSPVPLELIGYGRNLNRDVLAQKKEQYNESIGAVRDWIGTELIAPLLERQWLLLGVWPDGLDWQIEWKSKATVTATDMREMGMALAALRATGLFRDETLLRLFGTIAPNFDAQAEIDALAERVPDMAGRIAGQVD